MEGNSMCNVLMSINPEYVENIFSGLKKYEYRKIKCKKEVDKIIIYCTSPVMKVVGEAQVEEILEDSPEIIWKMTKQESGTTEEFYNQYFQNRKKAVAYKLTNIKKYTVPRELATYGIKSAPQSYVYI